MSLRFSLVVAFSFTLTNFALAAELTTAQKDVWDTVETFHRHFLNGNIAEAYKSVHKDLVWWNKITPIPGDYDAAFLLDKALAEHTGNWLAYDITPLTVLVFDTFAVVNFYVRGLREQTPGGNAVLVTQRYHNTWKKGRGGWLLVANYNAED